MTTEDYGRYVALNNEQILSVVEEFIKDNSESLKLSLSEKRIIDDFDSIWFFYEEALISKFINLDYNRSPVVILYFEVQEDNLNQKEYGTISFGISFTNKLEDINRINEFLYSDRRTRINNIQFSVSKSYTIVHNTSIPDFEFLIPPPKYNDVVNAESN
ncbi:hypothetical protein TRFO_37702 [Tritrichomonas foetus]|uniref:Uncharacterized protein n=1 Tax=Tritrichomonas foetus TaxID=1144522 RepID=A0A1J4JFB1_9EUKA|nr:hypothetical protein TRFO_37702 [Tritrichomonas foetus]|eukprot:OHS96141.1 hypothetical protein TRFO_37702 [Tritrichomonas foetus]